VLLARLQYTIEFDAKHLQQTHIWTLLVSTTAPRSMINTTRSCRCLVKDGSCAKQPQVPCATTANVPNVRRMVTQLVCVCVCVCRCFSGAIL